MKAVITEIIQETRLISSFRLKPANHLAYQPGQWMYVTLSQNLKHHFTISSSPTEDFLQFTTIYREESEYKKVLFSLRVGDVVDINGPFGSFVLDPAEAGPHLFIAGGIGITPFRSMIKYEVDKKLNLPIKLIYSVKTKLDAAFVDQAPAIVVETAKEGRLDEKKIRQLVPDFAVRTWWLCGPPVMVEAFVGLAQKMDLPPEKIKSEEFTGY